MIHKTLQRKMKIEQHEPHNKHGGTQVNDHIKHQSIN